MNRPISTCRRSSTQDSITALRHGSPPAWVETRTRLCTTPGMAQRQLLGDQAAQRLAHHVRRTRPDRLEPAGHVVGHVGRGVRTIESVALSRVAGVERQGAKSRPKMALRPAECPVVAPQPAQEDERVALAAHFLVMKRATLYDDLGHELIVDLVLFKEAQQVRGARATPAQGKENASNEKAKIDDSRERSRAPGNRGPSRSVTSPGEHRCFCCGFDPLPSGRGGGNSGKMSIERAECGPNACYGAGPMRLTGRDWCEGS